MPIASCAQVARRKSLPQSESHEIADVCLIVEGAYPFVAGGVSTWIDGQIRRHPSLRFCVVAILPEPPAPAPKYGRPPNLEALYHLYLGQYQRGHKTAEQRPPRPEEVQERLVRHGALVEIANEVPGER